MLENLCSYDGALEGEEGKEEEEEKQAREDSFEMM